MVLHRRLKFNCCIYTGFLLVIAMKMNGADDSLEKHWMEWNGRRGLFERVNVNRWNHKSFGKIRCDEPQIKGTRIMTRISHMPFIIIQCCVQFRAHWPSITSLIKRDKLKCVFGCRQRLKFVSNVAGIITEFASNSNMLHKTCRRDQFIILRARFYTCFGIKSTTIKWLRPSIDVYWENVVNVNVVSMLIPIGQFYWTEFGWIYEMYLIAVIKMLSWRTRTADFAWRLHFWFWRE